MEILKKVTGAVGKAVDGAAKAAGEYSAALQKSTAAVANQMTVAASKAVTTIGDAGKTLSQKVSTASQTYINEQKEKVKRIGDGLLLDFEEYMPVRGNIASHASFAFDTMTGKAAIRAAHTLFKARNRIAAEYPIIDYPFNDLKNGYSMLKNIGSTKAADDSIITLDKRIGTYLYEQDIWGLSDYAGELFNVRKEGAKTNVFSILGSTQGGVGAWLGDTVDGLLTVATEPHKTLEHLSGFAANIETALPAMVGGLWNSTKITWTEGTPEDKVRFCSYAITEVASWFIGVGEIKAASKSAKLANTVDNIGRWGNWSKYFNKVDDISRYTSRFASELSKLAVKNADNMVRQMKQFGRIGTNWADNAVKSIRMVNYDDLSRMVREGVNQISENFMRALDDMILPQREVAMPGGGHFSMSQADDLLGGTKPPRSGGGSGSGVQIDGGKQAEGIVDITEGAGGLKTKISPEMETKILEGQRKTLGKNEVIGGHSPRINNSNDKYAVEVLEEYADGTKKIGFYTEFEDGNISRYKKSTVFPENWTDEKIIDAVKDTGNTAPIGTRVRDGATLYRDTINGVQVEVIKIGDDVTSAYPTGGGVEGILPGFEPIK